MKRKLVVVETAGFLPEIGVNGPIVYPAWVSIKGIAKLVQNKRMVKACDPSEPFNKEKQVELTVENMSLDYSDIVSDDRIKIPINIEDDTKKESFSPDNKNDNPGQTIAPPPLPPTTLFPKEAVPQDAVSKPLTNNETTPEQKVPEKTEELTNDTSIKKENGGNHKQNNAGNQKNNNQQNYNKGNHDKKNK